MQTDGWMDRQMDMMKLVVTSHSFVNVPKKRAAASIKRWNSIKCLRPRETCN